MQTRTVNGSFTGMKGEIRDDHLRNADFFHVEEYPVISFESSAVVLTSNGYLTRGILSMHGISKEVEIPFTYEAGLFSGSLDVTARLEIIAVTGL